MQHANHFALFLGKAVKHRHIIETWSQSSRNELENLSDWKAMKNRWTHWAIEWCALRFFWGDMGTCHGKDGKAPFLFNNLGCQFGEFHRRKTFGEKPPVAIRPGHAQTSAPLQTKSTFDTCHDLICIYICVCVTWWVCPISAYITLISTFMATFMAPTKSPTLHSQSLETLRKPAA